MLTVQASVHVIHDRRNHIGNALAGNGRFKNLLFCLVKPHLYHSHPYQKLNRELQLCLIQLLLSKTPAHRPWSVIWYRPRTIQTPVMLLSNIHRRLQGRCRVITGSSPFHYEAVLETASPVLMQP